MSNIIQTINGTNPKREELKELLEELRRLKQTDIRDVDPDSLVDISEVKIRTDLSQLERLIDYLKQIRNLYCYKIGGTVVKVQFLSQVSISECLEDALFGGGSTISEIP